MTNSISIIFIVSVLQYILVVALLPIVKWIRDARRKRHYPLALFYQRMMDQIECRIKEIDIMLYQEGYDVSRWERYVWKVFPKHTGDYIRTLCKEKRVLERAYSHYKALYYKSPGWLYHYDKEKLQRTLNYFEEACKEIAHA